MQRPRVLVVDDKENMRKLLAKVLGDSYEVTTADDGSRALSLVALNAYDVVLTDIRMPGADGFQVLKAVKEWSHATEVVLIPLGAGKIVLRLFTAWRCRGPIHRLPPASCAARGCRRLSERADGAGTAERPGRR